MDSIVYSLIRKFIRCSSICLALSFDGTEFIWNWALREACTAGAEQSILSYFQQGSSFDSKQYQIQSGDLIWIESRFVHLFCKKVVPKLRSFCSIVISIGDETFPFNCCKGSDFEILIQNRYIRHIFAQNCGLSHPKITPIPIGIDFHTIAYASPQGAWGEIGSPTEQEALLQKIISTLKPTSERKKKAFVDFQLNDTMHGTQKRHLQFHEDRTTIFQKLLPTGVIDHGERMARSKLWEKKGEYAFSISPPGNGLDTHRTWEDLVLGCIVIVKSSSLNPLYEDLPVIIVQDWSEITEENMTLWLEKYPDALTNPSYREKLTNRYWIDKIKGDIPPK